MLGVVFGQGGFFDVPRRRGRSGGPLFWPEVRVTKPRSTQRRAVSHSFPVTQRGNILRGRSLHNTVIPALVLCNYGVTMNLLLTAPRESVYTMELTSSVPFFDAHGGTGVGGSSRQSRRVLL